MTDLERWIEDGERHGWVMPSAPWWKRLPIIRQVRAAWARHKVDQHNAFWMAMGSIPTGYDSWVIFGIWHGKERG